jgi:hypothetical protein
VAWQIEKNSASQEPILLQYLSGMRSMERQLCGFPVQHIDRAKNEEVDVLAKFATRGDPLPSDILYKVIEVPFIRQPCVEVIPVNMISQEDWRAQIVSQKDWRAQIISYDILYEVIEVPFIRQPCVEVVSVNMISHRSNPSEESGLKYRSHHYRIIKRHPL